MSVDALILNTCSICLDDTINKSLIPINCEHWFHEDCINHWIAVSPVLPTCPLCRQRVTHVNRVLYVAPPQLREDFPMEVRIPVVERATFERLMMMVRVNQIDSFRRAPALPNISPRVRGLLLIQACWRGSLEMVRLLLQSGDLEEDLRNRALCAAAERGHTAVVVALMGDGATSAVVRSVALSQAVSGGHEGTVISLLAGGERIQPNRLEPAIVAASRNGDARIVRALVNYSPLSDATRGIALRLAAMGGHNSVIQILMNGVSLRDRINLAATALCSGHARTAYSFLSSEIVSTAAAGAALFAFMLL